MTMTRRNRSNISLAPLKILYEKVDYNKTTDYILKNKDKFKAILDMKLEPDDVITVLKIIFQVSNTGFESSKSDILLMFSTESFVNSIKNLLDIYSKNTQHTRRENYKIALNHIVMFSDVLVNELPLAIDYYSRFISLLEEVLKNIVREKFENLPIQCWTVDLIQLLKNKILHLDRKKCNYTNLSLYPNPVDFFEKRKLRSNEISKIYQSAQEYLDIQFKLYKEDYIQSVKDGILQYKREIRGAEKEANPFIEVYNDVLVHSVEVNNNHRIGILHVILFSIEGEIRLKKEKCSDENRRFMNGQLLYFSSHSQFTTFTIATVIDANAIVTDAKGKEYKALKVKVIDSPSSLKVNKKYVLIEPRTFFEPYYQILKALKCKTSEFPMMKYILYSDFQPCIPKYLTIPESNNLLRIVDVKFSGKAILNKSQMHALKTALHSEFAIIQGPPGTGKTHLVKNIINVLIENKKYLSSPIFIVCARNNSLDHVLGPLAESGRKIIRLGCGTKNEQLKNCTIRNLEKQFTDKRNTSNSIKTLKGVVINKLNDDNASRDDVSEAADSLDKAVSAFVDLCDKEDAHAIALSGIDVIGATTTGAAKSHYLMSLIKPEVVIVEEAAEVFETHIVASIPQGCKHVILIGDHEQLQPTPAHYSSEKLNMHISLFERLVKNGISHCTLNEQHRMRPEIAALISPLIYKSLINHESVYNYPDIKGVSKNLFFIDHSFGEEQTTDTESHWNKHEAHTLLALADYLVKQGYSPKNITIISAYSAQVTFFNQIVNNYVSLKDIKMSSIDNYQGEENEIILLSLVRSQTHSIGFLKTHNRVNVALSRAKHGLFVIGNMSDLSSQSSLWQDLKAVFQKFGAIGKKLPLKCQTHQNITLVAKKADFSKLTLGGCSFPCGLKLICGHSCKLICHPSLEECSKSICKESCQRLVCSLHQTKCNRLCSVECMKCTEMVEKKLQCGHTQNVECFVKNQNIPCKVFVSKRLDCGHSATVPCPIPLGSIVCKEQCTRLVCSFHQKKCNRLCSIECMKCTEMVEKRLECGHIQNVECFVKYQDIPCKVFVSKILDCGHSATAPCHTSLGSIVCQEQCTRTCERGHPCTKLCYQPCGPCMEQVQTSFLCCTYLARCHET